MPKPPPTAEQIQELERIVSRQPGSRFFAPLAEAYLEQGRSDLATEVARRGLSENPGFVRGLSIYVRALYESGQSGEAVQVYAQACTQHPKESSLRADWGQFLARHGDNPGARTALLDALRINPLDFEARRALDGLPENTDPGEEPTKIRNLPVRRNQSGSVPILSAPPLPPPAATPIAPPAAPPPRPAGLVPAGGAKAAAARDARLARARSQRSARKSARLQDPPLAGATPSLRTILLPQAHQRIWIAAALATAVLMVLGIVWRGRARDVDRIVAQAHELYAHDTADALAAAQAELERAAAVRPHESRVQALLATVAATRAYRFSVTAGRATAERASVAAARAGAPLHDRLLAETLLRLGAGDVAGATALAQSAAQPAAGDPRALMAQGLVACAEGRLTAAEESFATALAYDRSWLWPALELARVQRRRELLDAARATVAEALLRAPRHVAARIEKIAIEAQAGNSPDELELSELDREVASAPTLAAELAAARGRTALLRNQADLAREAFARAAQILPADLEYAWLWGRAELLAGGDTNRALGALARAVPPRATAASAQKLDLADACLRAGRAHAALAALEGVENERAPVLLLMAQIELDAGKTVDHACQPASPSLDEDQLLVCAEWAIDRGLITRAQRLLARVTRNDLKAYAQGLLRLAEGSPAAALELLAGERARRARVRAQAAIGHTEAALADAQTADWESAGAWPARAQLARLLAASGNAPAARALLDRSLASRPDAPVAVATLAEALAASAMAQAPRRGEERSPAVLQAQKLVEAALAAHPQSPRLLSAQGAVALAASDADTAIKAYAAALGLDPASPRAYGGIVTAALAKGDRARAATFAKQALATSPDATTEAALAFARAGAIDAAEALVLRAAHAVDGPAAKARLRTGTLAVARAGLFAEDPRSPKQARRLVEKSEHDRDAPAYAVYLLARFTEREHGLGKALPLYRTAFERDPGLADAALRAGLGLSADGHTLEDGIGLLHRYLRLVKAGEGADRAHKELAKLGREPR